MEGCSVFSFRVNLETLSTEQLEALENQIGAILDQRLATPEQQEEENVDPLLLPTTSPLLIGPATFVKPQPTPLQSNKPLPIVGRHKARAKPAPRQHYTLRTYSIDKEVHYQESRDALATKLEGLDVQFINVHGRQGAALINFKTEQGAKDGAKRLVDAGYEDTHSYTGALGTRVKWWEE
jgi:hypothetical protein